ncbi:MAG: hypothetical protein ACM3U1_08765 [Chloroflexota bacterium]
MANKGIKTLDKGNVRWHFFPVYGLHIKNQPEWRNFIFDDATIVNTKQIRAYLKKSKFNDDFSKLKFYGRENDITYLIVQTIINGNNEEIDLNKARMRALEVISFIFFVFFYLSDLKIAICLDEQLDLGNGSEKFILSGNKTVTSIDKFTNGEYPIKVYHTLVYSRKEFEGILKKKQFQYVYKNIKDRKNTLLSSALTYFYINMYVPSPMTQLLGAVTTMEILLSTGQSKMEIFKHRIEALVGSNIYKKYIVNSDQLKGILDLRNSIAHKGILCTDIDAKRAIELATIIIIAFCNLEEKLGSNSSILYHLDFIYNVKQDKYYKNDIFGILKAWKYFELNSILHDSLVNRLIHVYGLCNIRPNKVDLKEYAKVIVLYAKIRECDLKKSHSIICNRLYYNKNPFSTFKKFEEFYFSNKEFIESEVDKDRKMFFSKIDL